MSTTREASVADSDGYNSFPKALKEREQWVCWREEMRNGEPTKVPVNPHTGALASSTDPDTWGSFEDAVGYDEPGDSDGLGFMFAEDGTLAGVDLDKCRDPDTGQPEKWAKEIVNTLDSYTEISPSGTGFHIYLHGNLPEGGNRKDGVEMYDKERFFTVTGNHIDGTPTTIETRAKPLQEVHSAYIADSDDTQDGSVGTVESSEIDLDDGELIEKAKNARNGEKFQRLWIGDTTGYPSHSEADLALCDILAFYTGPDPERIDRLFRRSGLVREKWTGREDYRERTISKALEGRTEYYDPGARTDGGTVAVTPTQETDAGEETTTDSGNVAKFKAACREYRIDTTSVGTRVENGEKVVVGIADIVPDGELGKAVMEFNREADNLSGTDRQAVIGQVVLKDLRERGEFFNADTGALYYYYDDENEVYRVDGVGNRILTEGFQGMVWDRYNLFAGSFSRNLGEDIKTGATREAPTRNVYRFAHYDDDAGELYVSDWDSGYYAVTPHTVEWRSNGTDVYFLNDEFADPYQYIEPDERDPLPDEIPGERPLWLGNGDPLMRLFGNRVNYDESAALGPAEQRKQLYLHLHTLPFIDVLNSRPIMAWVGEKGSGKTVIERSIGRFIYGDEYRESTMPSDKDDFLAKVTNQALAFVDNYDDGLDWANDVLAAIATGSGVDKRELYTTNDLRQSVPRCWLSLTSRDPPFRRDDVADRTLVFRVERVDDGFVGMGDYLQAVSEYRDLLWSAYLDNIQKVLREYHRRDTGKMSSSHRMADWAIFAKIAADALGVERVDELLKLMENERATFALENEPWAKVIDGWVRDDPEDAATWRKASSLSDKLSEVAQSNDRTVSMNAPGLGSKLTNYRRELGKLYNLEIDESGRSNEYRFAVDDNATPRGLERY